MKKLIPILALSLLTALPSLARLGETKAECETRYGKPVGTTKSGNPRYLKGGLEIVIAFAKDKAITLYIAKPKDGTTELDLPIVLDSEGRPELSKAEIDALLKANSAGSEWKLGTDDPFGDAYWNRADGKATASYASAKMEISDKAALHKGAGEKPTEEPVDLEGF